MISYDYQIMEYPTFKEMSQYYSQNFSLAGINIKPEQKFQVIMLINYIVFKAREKKPDITYYQIIYNIFKEEPLPEHNIYTLAIICNDYGIGISSIKDIPTFGLTKGQDMINTIKQLINNWLPF